MDSPLERKALRLYSVRAEGRVDVGGIKYGGCSEPGPWINTWGWTLVTRVGVGNR